MIALIINLLCVEQIRMCIVPDGIERALNEDPRPSHKRRLDGRAESTLIAITCFVKQLKGTSAATCGCSCAGWYSLEVVRPISLETVRRLLNIISYHPGKNKGGAFRILA